MKGNFLSPKPPPVIREPSTPSHCIAKSTNLSNSWHDTSKSLDNDLCDSSIRAPTYINHHSMRRGKKKKWKMRKIISNKRIMSEFSVNNKKSRLIKKKWGKREMKHKAQTTFTWFTIIQKHFSMPLIFFFLCHSWMRREKIMERLVRNKSLKLQRGICLPLENRILSVLERHSQFSRFPRLHVLHAWLKQHLHFLRVLKN